MADPDCSDCHGKGWFTCLWCRGAGRTDGKKCDQCNGSGRLICTCD